MSFKEGIQRLIPGHRTRSAPLVVPEISLGPISEQRRLALQARGIFTRASREYPAAVKAQSIVIALECRKHNLSADALMKALLETPDLIEKIREDAISEHVKSGKRKAPKDHAGFPISEVRGIIYKDFTYADGLEDWDTEALTDLLKIWG